MPRTRERERGKPTKCRLFLFEGKTECRRRVRHCSRAAGARNARSDRRRRKETHKRRTIVLVAGLPRVKCRPLSSAQKCCARASQLSDLILLSIHVNETVELKATRFTEHMMYSGQRINLAPGALMVRINKTQIK